MKKEEDREFETRAVHAGVYKDGSYNSVSTPIYQTSTFACDGVGGDPEYTYTRFANPTRKALEENLNALEGGAGAFAVCSGTAAIQLPLMLLKQGDHVICGKEVHGGTNIMLSKVMSKFGITSTFVDMRDLAAVKEAVNENTKLMWIETPTNPLLSIIDLEGVVEIARYAEALTVVDNTLMTPYWQRPFDFGVDMVVHSTTKYLNGHSDVVAGAVVARTEGLVEELKFLMNALGIGGAPFDAWLVLRGIKTLPHRLKAHARNAVVLAEYLKKHPLVKKVFYPGFEEHPGHEIAKKQQKSFGGMLCFEVDPEVLDLDVFFKELSIFNFCYSLGGVESIISHPWSKSHSCMTEETRRQAGVTPGMIRVSAGIEHPDDLVEDLNRALKVSARVDCSFVGK